MTNGSQTRPSLNRLSRFDLSLWHRFVKIAQPYWFPLERGGGKLFFVLMVLLLIFVFALLATVISALTLLTQAIVPGFMDQTAGGLVNLSRAIFSAPVVFILLAALIIPAVGFFLARHRMQMRWPQWGFLSLLLILSLSVSGLNVIISYVANFFTTALAEKDASNFWRFLYVYAGVFVVGTPIVVLYRYVQRLLGLYWRDWMTGKFLNRYFNRRSYYKIDGREDIDNPDQRISEDIRSFTVTSLRFLLIILGAIIDVISFTGILWSISRFLSIFLLIYAIVGTIITAFLGRRLIALNFNQLRKEADFRYGLVHVRDNAESIAFYRGEDKEQNQVARRFLEVFRNFNFLIGWQRNVDFFTTGYNYAIIILPSAIMAPLLFAGQIRYGDITQAGFAFSQVFSAFSIVVGEIEQLSAFAAGINRLETFAEALDEQEKPRQPGETTIDMVQNGQISLEHVTLQTPNYQRTLIRDLTVGLQPGEGLVIVGHSGSGKSSILRAIAGLWEAGTGKIVRPDLSDMLFLPQRPYMVLGTLRDQLLYPNLEADLSEADIQRALDQVNLSDLPERVGGFNAELDWADVLSLGEQQRLAFARLLLTNPRYAVLDEATSALDLPNERRLYELIRSSATSYISVGHRPSLLNYHQYVLELRGNTSWRLTPTGEYQPDEQVFA